MLRVGVGSFTNVSGFQTTCDPFVLDLGTVSEQMAQ